MSNPDQPPSNPTHILQEPVPFCPDEPYVGNVCVDDNILEGVRVALWNATHGEDDAVVADLTNGVLVLSGFVRNESQRTRCAGAVEGMAGVTSVINRLRCIGGAGTQANGEAERHA